MLNVKITYQIDLTPQEFRLVSSALRGKLKDEWREDAMELQDRMFQDRTKQVEQLLANISKIEGGVK